MQGINCSYIWMYVDGCLHPKEEWLIKSSLINTLQLLVLMNYKPALHISDINTEQWFKLCNPVRLLCLCIFKPQVICSDLFLQLHISNFWHTFSIDITEQKFKLNDFLNLTTQKALKGLPDQIFPIGKVFKRLLD